MVSDYSRGYDLRSMRSFDDIHAIAGTTEATGRHREDPS